MNSKNIDSKIQLKETIYQDNLTVLERWKAMLLDHFILCFTALPIFIIPFITGMKTGSHSIEEMTMLLILGIYLNKDFLSGRSAAKRLLGQVVIDIETRKPAVGLKCVIRNFTDIFWIVEVIIVLFSPSRRIGDFLARTKVVRTEKEALAIMLQDFYQSNKAYLIVCMGIAMFYIWLVFGILSRTLVY